MTEEERRAAEYRAQQARRSIFERQLAARLAAPPGPAAETRARWKPFLDWLHSRDHAAPPD